jgi:adenosine deaminase
LGAKAASSRLLFEALVFISFLRMPTLLISLGTSPAIVPEAYLLPNTRFSAVHVLTTASVPDSETSFVCDWFAATAPEVTLSLTRVADFSDFQSEKDHFLFEEVLYRWMLEKREGLQEPPFVCLSGGFKTMSAAMQKAAAVLGAAEVFHVLADNAYPTNNGKRRPASTAEEIADSYGKGYLHWIRLGRETGWPQFQKETAKEFPLQRVKEDGLVSWVAVGNRAFYDRIKDILHRSHRIAENWDSLTSLPFQTLATWSAPQLDWLGQSVDPNADHAWVAAIPKVELHCHLGGFATHGELLRSVHEAAKSRDALNSLAEPPLPEGWPLESNAISLDEYRRLGDANGSKLLRDSGCLRRQCELLYEHLREQNVIYAEIRCSPANYADYAQGRSPWAVLADIIGTFNDCMREASGHERFCHVNLIIIATREESGDYRARISRHMALAVTAAEHWRDPATCRVVGVDLAGYEDEKTRAQYFREEFSAVHRCGLALTVHAGENDDAEAIWRAVFDLNARRLGHALHLGEAQDLLRSVAARGIGVEMCPYANFQIQPSRAAAKPNAHHARCNRYPLKTFLDEGILVTVNTDNIGISAGTLTDNLLFAARLCPGLTRMDILKLQANALAIAFVSPGQRENLRSTFQQRLADP